MSDAPSTDRAIAINRRLTIPASELVWRFGASGGPGGQHANTSNTRAEVVWDIANSQSLVALTDVERERLGQILGPVIRVVASDERSQLRNRQLAETRLRERITDALRIPKSRRPTRPSRGAVERRLTGKSLRSETKAARRKPRHDD